MSSRPLSVFWSNITAAIEDAHINCCSCDNDNPSQARLPPNEPELLKAPFENICVDFFKLSGNHYLVIVDRLSGWPEVVQINQDTALSGTKSLCQFLRRIFATFGVPEEIASDYG